MPVSGSVALNLGSGHLYEEQNYKGSLYYNFLGGLLALVLIISSWPPTIHGRLVTKFATSNFDLPSYSR